MHLRAACGLLFTLVAHAGLAAASPPPKLFIAQYSGAAGFYNNAYAVAIDSAGNIYSAAESATGTGSQIAVVKYSPTGTQLWERSYVGRPGGGNDRPFVIKIDAAGNILVAGQSSGAGPSLDYVVLKLNPTTGVPIWISRYDDTGAGFNGLSEMALDAAGNAYITGQSWSGVDYDWATVKLRASDGARLWAVRQDGIAGGPDGINDAAISIDVDAAGNSFVCGWVQIDYNSSEEFNVYVPGAAAYDTDGNLRWFRPLSDATNPGQGRRVRIAQDGNPVFSSGFDLGTTATVKLNAADGTAIWSNESAGITGNGESVYDMTIDAFGDVLLAGGTCAGSPFCGESVGTRKINGSTGLEMWAHAIFDTSNPNTAGGSGRSIAVSTSGDVFTAGFMQYFNSQSNPGKAVAVSYDAGGNQLWLDQYAIPSSSGLIYSAVAHADGGNTVYVGTRNIGGGNSKMVTVRYGCQADFDGDGSVDFFDYDAFVRCLEGQACPPGATADFDGDGTVDFFDYDAFVVSFETGC